MERYTNKKLFFVGLVPHSSIISGFRTIEKIVEIFFFHWSSASKYTNVAHLTKKSKNTIIGLAPVGLEFVGLAPVGVVFVGSVVWPPLFYYQYLNGNAESTIRTFDSNIYAKSKRIWIYFIKSIRSPDGLDKRKISWHCPFNFNSCFF